MDTTMLRDNMKTFFAYNLILLFAFFLISTHVNSQTQRSIINDIDSAIEMAASNNLMVLIIFTAHGSSSTTLKELHQDVELSNLLSRYFVTLWLYVDDRSYLDSSRDTTPAVSSKLTYRGEYNLAYEKNLVGLESWPIYAILDTHGSLLGYETRDQYADIKRMIQKTVLNFLSN
jgi:thioredoxin-related protein